MLFISKEVSYQPLLDFLKNKGIRLIDYSMIEFEGVPYSCPKNDTYDIIFFSSPRSVHYFLEHCEVPEGKLVASIGSTTSKTIQEHSVPVDFEGDRSGNPDEVGQLFAEFVGQRNVLFPQSDRSNRSMQKQLKPEQVVDIVVYNTRIKPKKLNDNPEFIVFTSPSNADAFLQLNEIKNSQKVIAWGQTTEQFLLGNEVPVFHTLTHSTFKELSDYLKKKY